MTKVDQTAIQRRDLLRFAASLPLAATPFGLPGVARAKFGPLGSDVTPMQAAFWYAFPLFEFARVEQNLTGSVGNPGTLNQFKHRTALTDHSARDVTAPNNDTIYSSIFLDLSGGPVEIDVPDIHDRYFSVAFMDAFTDNFAYIGTRATRGRGGRAWVVGPNWRGTPPRGARLVRSTTNDVWALARILVDGPNDLPNVRALQQKFRVVLPEGRPPARGFSLSAAREAVDPINFLGVVNEMLARSRGGKGHVIRAARFAALGIGADAPPPSAELLSAWGDFLPDGIADLRSRFLFRELVFNGWTYQQPGVGNFGTNDQHRAVVALGGIAANVEKEAMYFHANFDGRGDRLDSSAHYRWHLPPGGVPVDGFWSLTMYDAMPDGRYFLVDNPIGRYSIGNRTPGLLREADGSMVILIQRDRPEGPMAANWLPAPKGPMRMALRAYLPRQELLSRKWRVPPIEKV